MEMDDSDDDSDDEAEDDRRRIREARALAYANRETRRQQVAALNFQPLLNGSIFTTRLLVPLPLLAALRADALALEKAGQFAPSGLTKAVLAEHQQFGNADRLVCRVTPNLGGDGDAWRSFKRHLDELRQAVGTTLGRSLICAEQYFSIHREGAFLQWHMDEKHEELKGPRGWRTSHRRSVSWLLYLSPECSGGELRGYCRDSTMESGPVGAHEGNLQVGWLAGVGADGSGRAISEGEEWAAPEPAVPVYMDAWTRVGSASPCDNVHVGKAPGAHGTEAQTGGWRPLSALYRLGPSGSRVWLSPCFEFESIAPSSRSTNTDALRQQLPLELQGDFSSVEAVPHEGGPPARVVDVSPAEGTLALFDSVSIPHEVLPTTGGTRIAMAGWWHEPQRAFPDGFDSSLSPKRAPLDGLPPVL